jgi:hypothetical protein
MIGPRIDLFSSFGQLQTERRFEIVLVYHLIFVVQFAMTLTPFLRVLPTLRVASTIQNFTLLPVAAYSASSGTGVQDLSGLKRSIFINSLKLANPKSFS